MISFNDGPDYYLLKRHTKKDGAATYYVQVLGDVLDSRGRRKPIATRSLHTGNKGLARKRAEAIIRDGKVIASKENLAAYLTDFWTPERSQYIKSKRAEGRTVSALYCQSNRSWIKRYFLPYFEERGIAKLNQLDKRKLLEWRNDLYDRREKEKITASTVNKVRQSISVALQWAEDMDLIPTNPMRAVPKVAARAKRREIFQKPEIVALFSKPWDDFRAFAACLFAVTTGARMGECRGLLESTVHDDYVDIVTNWQDSEHRLKPPKWDSYRYGLPVPATTRDVLRTAIAMNPYTGPDRFVFFHHNRSDAPIERHHLSNALKAACRASEVPVAERSFHSLRHTYVSLMRHSVGVDRVHLAVGHTGTDMTDSYTHETDDDRKLMQDAAERMITD